MAFLDSIYQKIFEALVKSGALNRHIRHLMSYLSGLVAGHAGISAAQGAALGQILGEIAVSMVLYGISTWGSKKNKEI